jgi:hypothetical protein
MPWKATELTIYLGQCRKGSACHFIHDPSKVAICKEYLAKGSCRKEPYCDLSHESTPHRVPPCSYFLRGNCTNTKCRYAHVTANPHAPICTSFATLGYCEEGADCPNRHEYECPEYASKGSCSTAHCRLPHIDRAGQLRQRKQAAEASTTSINSGDAEDQPSKNDVVSKRSSKSSSPGAQKQNFSQQDNFLSLETESDDLFEKRFAQ